VQDRGGRNDHDWRDSDRRNDRRERYRQPKLELRFDRELRMHYRYDHGRRIYVRG
jgi:hypothetical protein